MPALRLYLLALLSVVTLHAMADDTVRERRLLNIGDSSEEWILKWSGPVKPVCPAPATLTASCSCSGFEQGEQGQLILERKRTGAASETLNLSTLFSERDNPADTGNAVMGRLPRNPDDAFVERNLEDFAQQGMNATFLLQVGTAPCGKREMALVGVSRDVPHLHAFSTTAHHERPLVLQEDAWMALLAERGTATFTDLPCGDHGSEHEVEQIIHAHDGLLSVQENTYACRPDGARGALISSQAQ